MNLKIPNHIAMILDGNGRWAQAQGKKRTYGHEKGMEIIKDIAFECEELGIKFMTVYCFSTENWNRPKDEVDYLMGVPGRIMTDKNIKEYNDKNIKLNWIGRKTKIPKKTRATIENALEKTKDNTGLVLTFAIDYGSRDEIVETIQNIVKNYPNFLDNLEDFNYNNLDSYLFTNDLPNVDLMIRTGGEQRLSNFLLLQSAYAELYFTSTYWPDFNKEQLIKALEDYSKRDRRFGGLNNGN